ncbi:MAG TPA: ArgE/DapE family deacylase [Patescibacteria group bacterium]|nr:ArgE/DapE family deacylase [Patescibacteria group bacterium]
MTAFSSRVDERGTVELLGRLVEIDSVNPSLVPGAAGEGEIAKFLDQYMQGLGLKTDLEEVAPCRFNVIGLLKGTGGGRTLMLNGHTDTVGADYMEIDPFDPVVKERRMYGRGTYDMKGGLASLLGAVKAVVESGVELKGDVIMAAVCDEEFASIGTEKVVEGYMADAAIVGEPTELQIEIAHKGFAWIDIVTEGFAAHGSAWELGVDAIAKMGKVQVGLERHQGEVLMKKVHELVGPPSVHSSIIEGGRELSTYPDRCRLQVERRLIPGETRGDVEEELKGLLESISADDPKFKGSYEITFFRGPMEVPREEAICQILRDSSREITGEEPEFIGAGGWLDTQIIWESGTPAVAFGPGGYGAHGAVEYVDIDSVTGASRIVERAIHLFCG